MNDQTIKAILKLNKDFYDKISEHFDQTRNAPWQGWDKLLEIINRNFVNKMESDKISILDLGSGNGRFYKYLHKILGSKFRYDGVEWNEFLLTKAKSAYGDGLFSKLDIFSDEIEHLKNYDVIVAFGITHHIPDNKYRKKWFSTISNHLNDNGMLAITFWDFKQDKRFATAVKEIDFGGFKLSMNEIDNEDFFLGWDNMENTYRYFHYYTEDEKAQLTNEMGLKLVEDYISDGKDDILNNYLIWKG